MSVDAEKINPYLTLETKYGEALIQRRSVDRVGRIDSIVFDVDGVLIDVSESMRAVHKYAAEQYFASLGWTNCEGLIEPDDIREFKLAGGFNSDWELAFTWQLLYLFKNMRYSCKDGAMLRQATPLLTDFIVELSKRGSRLSSAITTIQELCKPGEWKKLEAKWDQDRLQRLFTEIYSGNKCKDVYGYEAETVKGPGLINKDRLFINTKLMPTLLKIGIATGRTRGETETALRMLGIEKYFTRKAIITEDDGHRKPDPKVLELVVQNLGAERPVYIGDTPDDMQTVRRYNALKHNMLSCMVLSGLDDPALKRHFVLWQADVIADNVNAALVAIDQCLGGLVCQTEKQL